MVIIGIIMTLLLFGIGILIKYKKATWLISGYNTASAEEKETYDMDKLCHHMSNFLFLLAAVSGVITLLGVLLPDHVERIILIGVIVYFIVIVGGVLYLNTGGRVKK